ncbi:MAG: hypothetical protein R3246_00640 [Acidimicrobiia bacterium]|nr:hypothetical protein [Acidimicrobiia bacterium]
MTPLLVTMVLCACGAAPDTATWAPPSATADEIGVFCQTYESVRNKSRQEVMAALYEVAPDEVRGPIKRASELASSIEDDAAIEQFLQNCS